MTMQELMVQGKKEITETENTLSRAEKVVEDTLQIGQQVGIAAALCVQLVKESQECFRHLGVFVFDEAGHSQPATMLSSMHACWRMPSDAAIS
jgi:hypothetical protein